MLKRAKKSGSHYVDIMCIFFKKPTIFCCYRTSGRLRLDTRWAPPVGRPRVGGPEPGGSHILHYVQRTAREEANNCPVEQQRSKPRFNDVFNLSLCANDAKLHNVHGWTLSANYDDYFFFLLQQQITVLAGVRGRRKDVSWRDL